MDYKPCPVCSKELSPSRDFWHFICYQCGYEKGDLLPAINAESNHELNEHDREIGLKVTRGNNFKKLISKIRTIKQAGSLLDVGAAHGWFLEAASKYFHVLGIEPDKTIYENAIQRNMPIRLGYFPDVLDNDEKFDIIIFNDVIEHITDINNVLISCHKHLNPNGLLALNLPNSRGFFYRTAKIFNKLGFSIFFNRLWQKELPSPHVHYFNLSNLKKLLRQHNFDIKTSGKLPSLHFRGLFKRISFVRNQKFSTSVMIYFGMILIIPLLKLLPSDIIYVISEKVPQKITD
jgi:2-polyprenyl-3-methyl-5-hydroxy-6-metoxy-1,4-benzoquinol methylase